MFNVWYNFHILKWVASIIIFLGVYTLFWVYFLKPAPLQPIPPVQSLKQTQDEQVSSSGGASGGLNPTVLGANTVALPESFEISFIPRRQQFGLSCEFSAATSIIYHYTGKSEFSPENGLSSEKKLIEQVGVSENPNLGIRMGNTLPKDLQTLYFNLNQRFGGADYYGVHAPPFVDVFHAYGLSSKILAKDDIAGIKQAIHNGHVIMTWIKVGYNQPIDTALSYGPVAIIRGEHSVVIHGYDASGVTIMDPGTGIRRHISYENLLQSSRDFIAPFLEVYPFSREKVSVEETVQQGNATGLSRSALRIEISNGSGKIGVGNDLAVTLKEFGYHVSQIRTVPVSELEGIEIKLRNTHQDYLYILKRDLNVANYAISSISADLSASSAADVVITVGE